MTLYFTVCLVMLVAGCTMMIVGGRLPDDDPLDRYPLTIRYVDDEPDHGAHRGGYGPSEFPSRPEDLS